MLDFYKVSSVVFDLKKVDTAFAMFVDSQQRFRRRLLTVNLYVMAKIMDAMVIMKHGNIFAIQKCDSNNEAVIN